MRASFLNYATIPAVLAIARWFQPLAVVAVILIMTLAVALRRAERLRSTRQLWVIAVLVGSGLMIAVAFLAALQWMTKMGVL